MKIYIFLFGVLVMIALVVGLLVGLFAQRKNSFNTMLPVPNTSVSFEASVNGFYDRGIRLVADRVQEGGAGGFLGSLSWANILPSGEDGLVVYTVVSKKQSTQALARDIADGKFNNRQLAPEESSGVLKEVKGKDYYIFSIVDTMGYPAWIAMTYGKNEAIIVDLIFSGYSDPGVLKESKTEDSFLKVLSHINFD